MKGDGILFIYWGKGFRGIRLRGSVLFVGISAVLSLVFFLATSKPGSMLLSFYLDLDLVYMLQVEGTTGRWSTKITSHHHQREARVKKH